MKQQFSNHAQRRMHTIPLNLDDALNEYLDEHEGFVTKAALMAAALKHFRDCHLAKYRDVSEGQTGNAYDSVERWISDNKSTYTVIEFLFLLESIAVSCRFDVTNIGSRELIDQVAGRLDVRLLLEPFATPNLR
jgi:hypothetical protein